MSVFNNTTGLQEILNSINDLPEAETGSGSGSVDSITVTSAGVVTATAGGSSRNYQISSVDDADFVSSNIKDGVGIFGITGSYKPSTTTLRATSNGTYNVSGYDGYSSVIVAIPVYNGE